MSESTSFQEIDGLFLKQKLKSSSISQKILSDKLGVDDGSLSRWISKNLIPANMVWRIRKEIGLSVEDVKVLLKAPSYRVYFRRKFLGKVQDHSERNAINWAQTFLSLSTLHSDRKFLPIDLSSSTDAELVAEKIRDYLKFDQILSIRNMVSLLREQGIEVGFIPFSKLEIDGNSNEKQKEVAFTVTDFKRYCIFLDTNSTLGALTFHLGHEIAHIFRASIPFSKEEEKFCNSVAAALIYPKSYFMSKQEKISEVVSTKDFDSITDLIEQIVDDVGGEFEGVVYRLIDFGLLPAKSGLTTGLIGFAKRKTSASKKISEAYFKNFIPGDTASYKKFWESEQISSSSVIFRYYDLVKRAVSRDDLSPKKLSELFLMDSALADELATHWRYTHQLEIKEANENNSK